MSTSQNAENAVAPKIEASPPTAPTYTPGAAATHDVGLFFDQYAADWDSFYGPQAGGRAFDYLNRQRVALACADELLPQPSRILEFGCGAGHTAVELAKRGHRVACVDISAEMIAATERTFARVNLPAQSWQGTVHDVPDAWGSFDAVMAYGVMDYIPDAAGTLRRVAELLKPGGFCVLSYTNSATPFRWIELPLKRFAAALAYVVTRQTRFRDVAFRTSSGHSSAKVRDLYQAAGLQFVEDRYFSYGLRLGRFWCPPLFVVRRWDRLWSRSWLRGMGRGFMAIGRKPNDGGAQA